MKKIFVLLALMTASLSLWAAQWEPKDIQKAVQNYEALVQTLSPEEQSLLTEAQNIVNNALQVISNIELYEETGLLDKTKADMIIGQLHFIEDFYERIESFHPSVSEPYGTWIVLQIVKTKDVPYLGRLDEVFMKFANLKVDSDLRLAERLAKMANKFESNYDSVLAR